ncbi:MAG TPA: hypothetical protein VIF09_01940, partial [Polyangiaceae bacterium]
MATPQLLSTTDQIALPTSLVLASRLGQVTFIPSTPPKGAGSNTLPVIQDGSRSMTPGQLYPSSGDPNQRLYLPAYQIATMTLVPALNGVGGTVNATLTAPVPQAASG